MNTRVRIELENLGRSIEVERGSRLRDVLQAYGVEFPCGGRGRCKRCRIRVLEGVLASDPGEPEVEPGWSLACHARVESDVVLQLEQFGVRILSHDSAFRFEPAEGYGIAVDLGTTTLVGQLIELRTGRVRAVECALNPQRAHGSDIMQRTQYACEHGAEELQRCIRREIGTMLRKLVSIESQAEDGLERVVIVGNTVMHHLFCGLDLEPLARFPFESSQTGLQTLEPQALGWDLAGNPTVYFLPCIGGFVGSDVLAGVFAMGLQESSALELLVDLGTNGEIVLGNAEQIWCASTAAGPAFEAGSIEMGMQATTGAIHEVLVAPAGDGSGGVLRCGVLGQVDPRGRLRERAGRCRGGRPESRPYRCERPLARSGSRF